jgi:hypothetical protein
MSRQKARCAGVSSACLWMEPLASSPSRTWNSGSRYPPLVYNADGTPFPFIHNCPIFIWGPTYTSINRLFLIPASRVPLRRIFIDDRNILLAYANGKARVWNVETCEFRRSTGLDAAEEMLQSGTWVEMCAAP